MFLTVTVLPTEITTSSDLIITVLSLLVSSLMMALAARGAALRVQLGSVVGMLSRRHRSLYPRTKTADTSQTQWLVREWGRALRC